MLSTKLNFDGKGGISGGECVGEEEYGWGFWVFNIIIQKMLSGLKLCLTRVF